MKGVFFYILGVKKKWLWYFLGCLVYGGWQFLWYFLEYWVERNMIGYIKKKKNYKLEII